MGKSLAKDAKPNLAPLDLVGRGFHTFTDDGRVENQGVVRGDLGDGYYLVQYFEWFVGAPNTMAIWNIRDMKPGRKAGCWQFYEDTEHMNFWYEHHAKKD
jgi:hypothetical protein